MRELAIADSDDTLARSRNGAAGGATEKIYVSDFLEEILNASAERRLTREICCVAVNDLPADVVQQADYYGGKCMGYPAIWLLRHALGLDRQRLTDVAMACRASLFLSLTASIVDDWIDRDQPVTIAPVSLLYMLMVRGLASTQTNALAHELVTDKLQEVIEQLLIVERSAQFSARKKLEICASIARDSGIKIGNFHELIAAEVCGYLSLEAEITETLRRLANGFGRWCALLDDIIDVRSDIAAGEWASLPAASLLMEIAGSSAGKLSQPAAVSPDAENRLIPISAQQLADLGAEANEAGFTDLAKAIELARDKLPGHLATLMANRHHTHPA